MKRFIRNLEKTYLSVFFLVVGILLFLFPEQFSKRFPWVIGVLLIVRAIAVIVLSVKYKDSQHSPGKAIVYCVLSFTIMRLGSESIGIIGVIWAVFALIEVAEEIDEMWQEKRYSNITLISSIISIVLAILLMTDPFRHFVVHIRVLGLEILVSSIAKGADVIKNRIDPDQVSG